jgi:hypothetical protein
MNESIIQLGNLKSDSKCIEWVTNELFLDLLDQGHYKF